MSFRSALAQKNLLFAGIAVPLAYHQQTCHPELAALQRKAATQAKDPASARSEVTAAGNSHDNCSTELAA